MKASIFIKGVKRMAKKEDQKPEAVRDAELHGGESYDLQTNAKSNTQAKQEAPAADVCPDCNGEGISDPLGLRVCQRCEGSGKA
jgi:DnaJ-class molecular chaperone